MKSNVKSQELTACLVVRSNWGDPRKVGLTEIQFIDQNKRKIPVVVSAVSIGGASVTTDNLSSMFNGKCKVCLHLYLIDLVSTVCLTAK